MRNYDFEKAKRIIEEGKEEIVEASMGMMEDWFWTAETVWEEGDYQMDLDKIGSIAGLGGSEWATPVIILKYKDGNERMIKCLKGKKSGERPSFSIYGCLSEKTNEYIENLELEEDNDR
ncbi:MAG: hypothetical protein ACOC1X_03730 [Promethearchaeota archaeon]